jgi:hypothetical protein
VAQVRAREPWRVLFPDLDWKSPARLMSSLPRYRGPIETVEHAFMVGMVLEIRC